jgi:hypothetical protein
MNSIGTGNPTALKVGQEGTLFGHRATVIGRSVLKSKDGYRWNEYHLKMADVKDTSLVYESGIWKRFALFDPGTALSASDAADFGVGDPVTLGSSAATVTYVGESRVTYIEGRAPEGYSVGSEAHYFNAEVGNQMFVVSWTGSEVEFYEGENLPRGDVERAFGLPNPSLLARIFSGGSGGLDSWLDGNNRLLGTILFACAFFVVLFFRGAGASDPTVEPPLPTPAPALHLAGKVQGDLAGHHYTVVGHQVNEIAETRGTFGRHEYDLADEQGEHSLLIQGLSWNARQWYLFRPSSDSVTVRPAINPTYVPPDQAATFVPGFVFRIEDEQATVRTLFLCRTMALDGEVPPSVWTGSVRYGFTAQTKDGWVLARWNESQIEFYMGRILSEQEVRQAFGPDVSK